MHDLAVLVVVAILASPPDSPVLDLMDGRAAAGKENVAFAQRAVVVGGRHHPSVEAACVVDVAAGQFADGLVVVAVAVGHIWR